MNDVDVEITILVYIKAPFAKNLLKWFSISKRSLCTHLKEVDIAGWTK